MRLGGNRYRHGRAALAAAAALLTLCSAAVLLAVNFQLFQLSPTDVERPLWPASSITWALNPVVPAGNVHASSGLAQRGDLVNTLTAAFNTWQSASYQGSLVDSLAFTRAGADSSLALPVADCNNVVGFADSFLPTGTVAQTVMTYVSSSSGPFQYGGAASGITCNPPVLHTCPYKVCLADADIEFNPNYQFATYSGAPAGQYDLQSIATHEIGHLIGLDHSGIAHSVMYPYGDLEEAGVQRALWVDDEIGAYVLYPNPNSAISVLASKITGTVTLGGSPAFAAHVIALDPASGNVITDTLSDPAGNYQLQVFEGTYNVLVLPLAPDTDSGPYTLGNFNLFACGYSTSSTQCILPTNFTNFTGHYY